MPIYEYQCPDCGLVFEEWVKITEAQDTLLCPRCGVPAHHVVSATTFLLKGGGWYVTEYGNRRVTPNETTAAQNDKASATSTDNAAKTPQDAAKTAAPAKPTQDSTASSASTRD